MFMNKINTKKGLKDARNIYSMSVSQWKEMPCECGGMASRGIVKYKEYKVRGWVCQKCKKEYIHPEDSVKMSKTVEADKIFESIAKSINFKGKIDPHEAYEEELEERWKRINKANKKK